MSKAEIRTVSAFVAESIKCSKKDFRVDYFCTGGPGGQHQNSNRNGVRITCLKTGISSEGRELRSAPQNKSAAFRRLVGKLIEYYEGIEKQTKLERFKATLAECRVYKENLQIAKDSETGYSQSLQETLDGNLGEFIKRRMLIEIPAKE